MISQDRLKELLNYDPETGLFTRKVRTSASVNIGDIAGCKRKNGYFFIKIEGKGYLSHRLAFVWMTGSCPEFVDHINRNPSDNRWVNLRSATRAQNNTNKKSAKGSSSKYLGVCWHKLNVKWQAKIGINGKRKHLGYFKDEDDAAKAYDKAAIKYFGEYANLNFRTNETHDEAR